MSSTKPISILKEYIGKPFKQNPSRYGVWLGGILVEAEEGKLTAEFTVRNEMLNGMGTLHGGVIAGILDDMIGTTVVSLGFENSYTTVSLNVDYFYPSKENDVITAKAYVVKKGSTIHYLECELWNLKIGKLLAKASSNVMKVDYKVSYPIK